MINDDILPRFYDQFDRLVNIIAESNSRVISEHPDDFFVQNANVFTKAYIVSACSILEAFIQDITFSFFQIIDDRISSANIPRNVIFWSTQPEVKKDNLRFEKFTLGLDRSDFTDIISGNIHRTIKVFQYVGIDLDSSDTFKSHKDFISSFINKRNRIIHHNDDAVDISFSDIIDWIGKIKSYCECIFNLTISSSHLQAS